MKEHEETPRATWPDVFREIGRLIEDDARDLRLRIDDNARALEDIRHKLSVMAPEDAPPLFDDEPEEEWKAEYREAYERRIGKKLRREDWGYGNRIAVYLAKRVAEVRKQKNREIRERDRKIEELKLR